MFRQKPKTLAEVLALTIRQDGLETPLLQKRLIDSWPEVVGEVVSRYTTDIQIHNQVLYVKLSAPVLRMELSMRRKYYVTELNRRAGSFLITDIRFS